MGIMSTGAYGIPEGVIYSHPVTIDAKGQYTIVPDLDISDFSRELMDKTYKELLGEKELALTIV